VAVEDQVPSTRTSSTDQRAYLDEVWRRLPELAERSASIPRQSSLRWVMRQVVTVALAHVGVLVAVYFLLLLGDALFTSYAIVMQDAVFVSYVAQLGWLQRMASDVKGAIAFVVGLSALLQMLLVLWRTIR
jgi:hypothetical protein